MTELNEDELKKASLVEDETVTTPEDEGQQAQVVEDEAVMQDVPVTHVVLEAEAEDNGTEAADDKEFHAFLDEVLKKMPVKSAGVILGALDQTKAQAEKVLGTSKERYEGIFDEFLVGVDPEVRKKSYTTIHAATLTAAIIGLSPIPFSDAILLVPVQTVMMSRLHKLFGRSWSESIGWTISKELVVVGFGRSIVGNLIKFIPGVGTLAGAAINGVVASGITATLGWVTVKMLNEGEDIFDNVLTFKGQFNSLYKTIQASNKKNKG